MSQNSVECQFSQTTNSSTSKHEFFQSLHDNLWKLYIGKVSAYSCERTMKEYVHGLFTTDVENWTSNCRQLYFVESIRKNFVLADGTGSYCNGGLHSHFTSRSGFRSVFWTYYLIILLFLIMIKKCCGNDVAAFAKLSHVTFICTYSDRRKYVSGGEKFLCRSHILALIFVDL